MAWTWEPAGDQNFWAEESITGLRLFVERKGNTYDYNGRIYLQQQVAQNEVQAYGDVAIIRHEVPPR